MTTRRLTVLQVLIIAAMSCAATYTFYMSFAYPHMRDAVAGIPDSPQTRAVLLILTVAVGAACAIRRDWLLAATWTSIMLTLSELLPLYGGLGTSLALLGMLLVLRASLLWAFLGIAFAFCFPSLMAFSSADWFWSIRDLDWETELGSAAMAALFGVLVAGHLVLRHVTLSKRSKADLVSQGFDPGDVETMLAGKLRLATLALLGASLVTAVIVGAAIGLDRVVGEGVSDFPLKPVLFGVGGSAIMIAAVYYVLLRREPT